MEPKPKVIVAGIPRTGTTLLFRALAGMGPDDGKKRHFLINICRKSPRWHHSFGGRFYKTHSPAPPTLPPNHRVIFTFGNPYLSAVSLIRTRWEQNSCRNSSEIRATAFDVLDFARQFDSYKSCTGHYPVLMVRYETMYKYVKEIADFAQVDELKLPPWKARRTSQSNLSKGERDKLEYAMGDLAKAILSQPDIKRVA